MGWEDRNGKQYYYRKKRVGRQVLSEYVGSGFFAEWIAEKDDLARNQRRRDQKAWDMQKAEEKQLDSEMDLVGDLTRSLLRANLLLEGFHPHRGQWRKRRSG